MSETIATVFVMLLGLYMGIGLVFAIPFAFKGAGKIDPSAAKGTLGFKLLIIPGAIALWPMLANRWRKNTGTPPEEKNAHRIAACKLHAMKEGGAEK